VHADSPAFLHREACEHAVVEVDEGFEETFGGIELDCEPAFGEVDLDAVSAMFEGAADVELDLADEVCEEVVPRVALDAVGRVDEAERGGGDDGLLERPVGEWPRPIEIGVRIGAVPERAGGQPRQRPGVPVGERDRDTVRFERLEPVDRVRREARLALLAVRYDRRPGFLEIRNRLGKAAIPSSNSGGLGMLPIGSV
jgi:hypothetical protein